MSKLNFRNIAGGLQTRIPTTARRSCIPLGSHVSLLQRKGALDECGPALLFPSNSSRDIRYGSGSLHPISQHLEQQFTTVRAKENGYRQDAAQWATLSGVYGGSLHLLSTDALFSALSSNGSHSLGHRKYSHSP